MGSWLVAGCYTAADLRVANRCNCERHSGPFEAEAGRPGEQSAETTAVQTFDYIQMIFRSEKKKSLSNAFDGVPRDLFAYPPPSYVGYCVGGACWSVIAVDN